MAAEANAPASTRVAHAGTGVGAHAGVGTGVGAGAGAGAGAGPSAGADGVRAGARAQTLIVVHLRGAADGLSLLVPYADPDYQRRRPSTALAAPGCGPNAVIDLNGRIGLHPRLSGLASLFHRGELSAWPAVGLKEPTTSHAVAERRLFDALREHAGESGIVRLSERARPYPGWPLASQLEHLAARIVEGRGPTLAWVEMSGWDTHVAQGNGAAGGRFADQCGQLEQALLSLRAQLGQHWRDTTLIVASELGRSIGENNTSGTDEGGAGAVLVMGGAIEGGRVFGSWPKLGEAQTLQPNMSMPQLIAAVVDRAAQGQMAGEGQSQAAHRASTTEGGSAIAFGSAVRQASS
jgi:uncharacterized protein (DUF1501 family)